MSIENDFKKIVSDSRPRKCLGSDFLPLIKCNELISAHSIQNNGVLNFIAEGSQTLLHRRLELNENRESDLISFEKIGRKAATTFGNGMCGNHDKKLFQCLEDEDFQTENKKQLVTFAIRSLLKETYTKQHISGISNSVFDGNDTNPFSVGYNQANDSLIKAKKDLRKIYVHEKRNYKDFETKIFTFNTSYKIGCSSVISPWFGFNGEEINSQNLKLKDPRLLYVNVFPNKGKTYILFGFLKEDEKSFQQFFKYLKSLNSNDLKKALSAVLVCYCQNIVLTDKILDNKTLVEKINKITNETQKLPPYLDIEDPNYLKEIIDRDIDIFFN